MFFKRILCYKDVNQVECTGEKKVEIKYGVHLSTQKCHWPCTLIELNEVAMEYLQQYITLPKISCEICRTMFSPVVLCGC